MLENGQAGIRLSTARLLNLSGKKPPPQALALRGNTGWEALHLLHNV